jgi:hypothetical protein
MPRPNIPMTTDDLMLAQVRRSQELRRTELKEPKDIDVEMSTYLVTFSILITFIMVVLALA